MIKFAIHRPVLVTVIFLGLAVMGLFAIVKLNVTLMPSVDIPVVTVKTLYPGAGPDQIETLVTKPIEDAVSTTNNLKHVSSASVEGVSFVIAEFTMDVKIEDAAADVREKVAAIRDKLPDDVKEPEILKLDLNATPVIYVGFSGPDVGKVYHMADKYEKPILQTVPGVGNIDIIGGLKREIKVEVFPDKLKYYGLDLVTLSQRIDAENVNIPSGRYLQGDMEISGRLDSEFTSISQIATIEIPIMEPKTGAIRTVHLSSIAQVRDSYAEIRDKAKIDRKDAVALIIQKQPKANTIRVVDGVRKKIDEIQKNLPPGYKLTVVTDTSTFIRDSVKDVKGNLLMGVLITGIVLFLFLRSIGSTFVVILTIPTALIGTFFFMFLSNFTLNVLTLSSLSLCVGVIIDSSIVVLENIFRHGVELKQDRFLAAEQGAIEVAPAVTASIMTNVVVFLPIAFMTGLIGQFFREFGMVQVYATIIAFVVTFTMLPMLAARFLNKAGQREASQRSEEPFIRIREGYKKIVARILRRPGITFLVVAIFVVSSFLLIPLIGIEFSSTSDQGVSTINIRMPPGTNLDKTEQTTNAIENELFKLPELDQTFTTIGQISGGMGSIGSQSPEYASVLIDWKDKRKRSTTELIDGLKTFLASLPGAVISAIANESSAGKGGPPIQLYVTGENWDVLLPASEKILNLLRNTDGIIDADSSYHPGKPEINFVVDRQRLSDFDLSPYSVAMNVRAALEGLVSSKYKEGDDEYDIRVTLPDNLKKQKAVLANLPLTNSMREVFVLKQVADVKNTSGPTMRERYDRKPSVTISANVTQPVGTVMSKFNAKLKEYPLPRSVQIEAGGDVSMMKEAFSDLGMALVMAMILVYLVMAAQFESWIEPFIILGCLALAVTGIFFGLFIFGQTICIFSLLGVVILTGIGVNNGILIINFSKDLIKQGKKPMDAILEASSLRLRPCLMTTATTIAATLPLAFGRGKAVSFKAPMGITIISGAVSALIFTLFVLPLIYYLYTSRRQRKLKS